MAQLVTDVLHRLLPDDHPAAALWARVSARLEQPPTIAPVTGQLLTTLPVPIAARLMSTTSWPLIEQRALAHARDGDTDAIATIIRSLGPATGPVERYADDLLARLSPDSTEAPDADATKASELRDRATRLRNRTAVGQVSRQDEPDHPPRRPDEPSQRPDDPRTPRL